MNASTERDGKRARLELQLRENLKRRKDQARARRDAKVEPRENADDASDPDEGD